MMKRAFRFRGMKVSAGDRINVSGFDNPEHNGEFVVVGKGRLPRHGSGSMMTAKKGCLIRPRTLIVTRGAVE